ncbi:bifunctional endoribonuclease/protein kinase ire1 [Lignoscripta atroalba]|nr:bifunctional endoribonuclease/protein kinase ire1 [Lignoscripta atroalba]
MMRRQNGAGRTFLSALAASFILFPIVLASQQQEQQYYRKSPHEHGPQVEAHTSSGPSRHHENRDGRQVDTTNYERLKDTSVNSNKASAIATLAPAGVDHAVRAPQPVQGSGKSAGLSSLLNARSLQDWEVEDFILLATVDGAIHARDRKTGTPRWALEVDRPMVETIYHRQNKSAIDEHRPEDDFLWIVEPSRDGDIYIYNQGLNGGLQRLRLTVKKLVEELSPYAGEDPAVVYTAEKQTTLYTVDAGTGKITKKFSSRGSSIYDDQSCRRVVGLEGLDEEECGSSGSLILGRTEYTIGIQHQDTTEPICTLMYSEWGPNNRDSDLHSQYSTTMDKKYVYSRHDGSIFGFDHARLDDRRKSYTQKLSSPVVRVFDVARPTDVDDRDPQLIILPQPVGPIDSEDLYNTFSDRNRIFVNQTEAGGWYAMSENTYPLVTGGAATAQCYNKDWLEMTFPSPGLSLAQRQKALVGVHAIPEHDTRRDSFMTISGPVTESINDTPIGAYSNTPALPSLPVVANSYIIGSAAANATDILIACVVLVIGTFLAINRRVIAKLLRQNLELKRVFPALEQPLSSVPSSPVVTEVAWNKELISPALENIEEVLDRESGNVSPTISRRNTLLEPPNLSRSRSGSIDEERGRTQRDPRVRIQEPSPSPAREDDDAPNSPQPGKKKARRGCRGGTKHKKKRSNSKHEQRDDVDQIVDEIMQIAKEPPMEPDILKINRTSSNDTADVSGPVIQIGHLKVHTDTVLGFGSHGTMVYKGSFGGRDVAVKRMLLEFYAIASHEVGLLQESDDHPNVIRYFDKESSGEFLYIALELCPASLQDVIEKPINYPALIGLTGLDLPDVLKQITAGVRYLHSLKIVHRDIKPQNILVSAPKKLPALPDAIQPPRLLISDFGLCKKLEGDQNSFRATTAHAAGTSGWRAPELLVDEDATSSSMQSPTTASDTNNIIHTGNSSEPAVVDPQTNRRATRAIDIFSLGCVFYYVLTGGNHPFDRDGKYMREANIVKGHYNLSDLENLGDYQWEAKDLVAKMLSHEPRKRPDASKVLCHPFFWPAEDRLEFLCHVSDQFEFEPRDPPSPALQTLESYADTIFAEAGGDFLRVLPKEFKDTLGKQRKYQGNKVLDLLRALRNKKNHYEDMPEAVKEKVGGLPAGYLGFWTRRFPGLLMACHEIVGEVGWEGRDRFRKFFGTG